MALKTGRKYPATIASNEDRADAADYLFQIFVAEHSLRPVTDERLEANREDWLSDLLAYLAHLAARHGIEPEQLFERGLKSYQDDNGDDPAFGAYSPVKCIAAAGG